MYKNTPHKRVGRPFPALGIVAAGLMLALSWRPVEARDWAQYEGEYFIAYSITTKSRTERLLRELELFRAAVAQVANLHVPEGAPKTTVVIFGGRREFKNLAGTQNAAGITRKLPGGRFLIVMPTVSDIDLNNQLIRREFATALLGWSNFRFPQWFAEGFTVMVSTIEFRDRNTAFTFGEVPRGGLALIESGASLSPGDIPIGIIVLAQDNFMNWDTLVGSGFDVDGHSQITVAILYGQSWLLTHYLMLGNDFQNTPKLMRYFELVGNGEASLAAFQQAFGMDPNDLWYRELKNYNRRLSYVVYDFRPDALHLEFTRTSLDQDALPPILVDVLQDENGAQGPDQ